ncbi:hypothetical protein [Serpentinicella alkaliphila]|uniref:hypothetical protein n=1 Tax=Serpentinicella alkaliphila TaxID=1734049 RepID=UPI00201AA4FD|nr:hypothetical protein [Serpentinicella alkaliphila]
MVADRGLNSGSNLEYLIKGGQDFVISYTLKRSKERFKEMVWDESNWNNTTDPMSGEIIYRSKVVNQNIEVKVPLKEDEISEIGKRGRPKNIELKKYQ